MIKVLELIDGGFIGGGQTHIISLCTNLDRKLFSAVIAADPDGDFRILAKKEGLEFTGISLHKIFRKKYLKKLAELVETLTPDIIHAHGGVAGMYARFLKKDNINLKVVYTLHGIHYIRSKNYVRRFVSLAIEQYLVKDCDAYICVSKDDVKTALDNRIVIKDKINLIPNGINIGRFKNGQIDRNLKARLGIKESEFVIGNISRFDEQKNQMMLINAFPEILRLIPDAKLLLVGDGLLYDECMNRAEKLKIADNIIFAGSIPDPENYYPLMDLFVFPSKWEGLSITLIEAMASGKCIAASDIPSNRELIAHGQNGILFSLGNSRALARVISDLYKNPDFRNNLSENAKKSSDNYDEKTMTEKISDVYKTLTE